MNTFLLGASTSAHQVEGNNTHSDYWAMEHMAYTEFSEPSGMAVDHYHRYEEDIALLAEAGLNAYRFSIEWARIEPEEGKFDEAEVQHYADVIACCKKHGVEPIVTLYHFTSPKWLIEKGGWENPDVVSYFERYARYIAEKLGSELHYVCTINEANMGIQVAAIAARYKKQFMQKLNPFYRLFHPHKKEESAEGKAQIGMNFNQMMKNMKKKGEENEKLFGTPSPKTFVSQRSKEGDLLVCKAHEAARKVFRELCPNVKIGLTLSLHDIQEVGKGAEKEAKKVWDEEFTHYLPFIRDDDFFGLQNYSRTLMGKHGPLPNPEGARLTQMEYENYPEALGHVIRKVHSELSLPILVTENGIATSNDGGRVEFVDKALEGVLSCVKDGIPVLGYCHWSLLDNFEWQKGFSMTFGLIAVDRKTMKRSPKPSLYALGKKKELFE